MQIRLFDYFAERESSILNEYYSDIFPKGVYQGMELSATVPCSWDVNMSSGQLLTGEGVKVIEHDDISPMVLNPCDDGIDLSPPTSGKRLFLIVCKHEYTKYNVESEDPPEATYWFRRGEGANINTTMEDMIEKYYPVCYPLETPIAYIIMTLGDTCITDDMIFNINVWDRLKLWSKLGDHIYNTNKSNVGAATKYPYTKHEIKGNLYIKGDLAVGSIAPEKPLHIRKGSLGWGQVFIEWAGEGIHNSFHEASILYNSMETGYLPDEGVGTWGTGAGISFGGECERTISPEEFGIIHKKSDGSVICPFHFSDNGRWGIMMDDSGGSLQRAIHLGGSDGGISTGPGYTPTHNCDVATVKYVHDKTPPVPGRYWEIQAGNSIALNSTYAISEDADGGLGIGENWSSLGSASSLVCDIDFYKHRLGVEGNTSILGNLLIKGDKVHGSSSSFPSGGSPRIYFGSDAISFMSDSTSNTVPVFGLYIKTDGSYRLGYQFVLLDNPGDSGYYSTLVVPQIRSASDLPQRYCMGSKYIPGTMIWVDAPQTKLWIFTPSWRKLTYGKNGTSPYFDYTEETKSLWVTGG